MGLSPVKKLQLSQNTPEWLEMRRLKIGASDCAVIMGEAIKKKLRPLWEEKTLGKQPFVNEYMRKGSRLEPQVLARFNQEHNTSYESACFVHEQKEWMLASYDGYDEISGTHIEIKCPSKEDRFKEMAYGEIPRHYQWQLQHQLAVSNQQMTSLVIYFEETNDLIVRDVYRDEEMIDRLFKAEEDFFNRYIIGFEIPL
jgi:putative phage-type endonuclease